MDTIIKRNYDRPVQNFSRRNERDVVPCYIFSISRIEESYFPLGWKKKRKKETQEESNGLTRNSLSSAVEKERQVHHPTAK